MPPWIRSRSGRYGIMLALMVFHVLLGAVRDEPAMILLTPPVFFPIVEKVLDQLQVIIYMTIMTVTIIDMIVT